MLCFLSKRSDFILTASYEQQHEVLVPFFPFFIQFLSMEKGTLFPHALTLSCADCGFREVPSVPKAEVLPLEVK